MHLDVFNDNLAMKLSLNDDQRESVADILDDTRAQIIIMRNEDHTAYEMNVLERAKYNECNRRILVVLTPDQAHEYRHWRGDVKHWIHENRKMKDERWQQIHREEIVNHRERHHDKKNDKPDEGREDKRDDKRYNHNENQGHGR